MMEMTASERFCAYLSGAPVDRAPVIEWAPWWNLTVDRWIAEGLPRENAGYEETVSEDVSDEEDTSSDTSNEEDTSNQDESTYEEDEGE